MPAVETHAARLDGINHSGSITAGGTPQDLMLTNKERRGFAVQNQSDAVMYIRSKGPSGANVAAADSNSLQIPIGAYYEASHVDGYAWSIFGGTTGKSFWAEEW